MSLVVSSLTKRFGPVVAADEVSFTLAEGQILALLGPSGSGKTTVLRMLAGLEHPDSGVIIAHNRTLFDGRRGLPAEQRAIGMVFQDYALWPNMTVAQNIAFGLRHLARTERAARVAEALALVHLEGLDERYPDQLSGGQQQRVAIARAMATRPPLLLLDESLSNLDAALREEMRVDIVRLLRAQGITAVYVTRDRTEALTMADRIVVMRAGRVVQIGSPEELYTRPVNTFIDGFLGAVNFIDGEVEPGPDGHPVVRHGHLRLRGAAPSGLAGCGVAVLRPEDAIISAHPPARLAGNLVQGQVVHSEFLGGRWRHIVALADDDRATVQALTPDRAPAEQVWMRFPVERCVLLPHASEPAG